MRKSEIEQKTQSDKSPMPDGLHAGFAPEGFADLIAYLKTLTLTPPAATGFEVMGLSHRVCLIVDPSTGDYYFANVDGAPAAGQQRLHHQARPAGSGRRASSSAPRWSHRCTPRKGGTIVGSCFALSAFLAALAAVHQEGTGVATFQSIHLLYSSCTCGRTFRSSLGGLTYQRTTRSQGDALG